jgi:hypothetical protein
MNKKIIILGVIGLALGLGTYLYIKKKKGESGGGEEVAENAKRSASASAPTTDSIKTALKAGVDKSIPKITTNLKSGVDKSIPKITT